jgi:TonB-linked SusC/RagA family outer membrane protein
MLQIILLLTKNEVVMNINCGSGTIVDRKNIHVMRNISLFWVFVIANVMAVTSYSQSIRFDIDVKNTTLEAVFEEIENNSEFSVIYLSKDVDVKEIVSVKVHRQTVDAILDKVLKKQNLSYEIKDKHIIIYKEAVPAAVYASLQQSGRLVTGIVTDISGEPLISVSIIVKGTTIGVMTDADGKFSIRANSGDALQISYVGYVTRTVTISDEKVLNIVLEEDQKILDEIVVIGYGVQHKEQITSSVTQIEANEYIMKNVVNPLEILNGQVAGLRIVRPNGGDVNGNIEVQLRGVTSLSGGLSPLVVVDGIVGIDLNNVILEEIESLSVLKDGSAAAIYGTRGTNGVIIITTKKHRKGGTKVEFASYLSTQRVAKTINPLSAGEFREALALKYDTEQINLYDHGHTTDWFDEVTRTPMDQYYNLSFSSGNDELNYRLALNYKGSQGLVKKNDNNVLRANVNVNQKMLDSKITVNYNASFSKTNKKYTDTNVLHQAFQKNPTEPVYDPENTRYGGYHANEAQLTYYNPVAMINERDNNADWQYFTGSTKINYHILEGLNASVMGSIVSNTWRNNYYHSRYYPVAMGTNGSAGITSHQNLSNQLDFDLSYVKSFGKNSFDAILGYSYYDNTDEELRGENSDFDTDYFGYNNLGAGYKHAEGLSGLGSWKEKNKLIAFYARVQYNYNSKYILSASLRREGSTRFGDNNKWGMFPAVSAGWRINRETFLEDINWINMLKIRAGIGITGNQDIGNYGSLSLLDNGGGKMYYNGRWINTYQPASNPNPDLKWERKTEYNLGFDYGFFDNRISGAIDYYIRSTDNLLWTYDVPVPPNLFSTTYDNVGKIENKGIEVSISADIFRTKDLKWNSTLLFSHNKNKLISFSDELRGYEMKYLKTGWISEDIQTWTHYIEEGGTLGNFYAKVYTGMDEEGNPRYLDLDGVEGISDADRKVVGNAYPDAILSFNNNLIYKNWDLGILLRASIGNDVLNIHRAYYDNMAYLGGKNTLKMALNNPGYKGGPDYSSRYIEDASFLKLDNLILGYTFRFQNAYINFLRVYGSAQNLFTITKYKGVDPEVNMLGLSPGVDSYYYYPRTQTFTLGVNLVF